MAPWMVIAALIGTGFAVLLIAPTVHRRINVRSRSEAERARRDRVANLRDSPDGASHSFASARHAVAVRDVLLLRGVRAEVVSTDTSTELVYRREDADAVEAAVSELGAS